MRFVILFGLIAIALAIDPGILGAEGTKTIGVVLTVCILADLFELFTRER